MPATHKIRFASQTDVGIKRSHNQDACATQPASDERLFASVGHVFVVADGMGGHAVGEKASAKAVRDVPLIFRKHVVCDSGRIRDITSMITTPSRITPMPRMNTIPSPPTDDPEPYPGSMESAAVLKNITSRMTPPSSGARNLKKKARPLLNACARKNQTHDRAVMP